MYPHARRHEVSAKFNRLFLVFPFRYCLIERSTRMRCIFQRLIGCTVLVSAHNFRERLRFSPSEYLIYLVYPLTRRPHAKYAFAFRYYPMVASSLINTRGTCYLCFSISNMKPTQISLRHRIND